MKIPIAQNTTGRKLRIRVTSLSTGLAITGLVFNSSGLIWNYFRDGDTVPTTVTIVTASLGTFTSGGFKEVDATKMPGIYEIGVPNAVFTVLGTTNMVLTGFTGMQDVLVEFDVTAVNDQSATAFITGINSLAPPTNWNALAISGGGDVTVGTNNDKTGYSLSQSFPINFATMSIDSSGRIDLGSILGTASAGAAGYVGSDWGKINAPTSTVNLSGTTISIGQQVASVSGSVGSVSGNVSGSVGSISGVSFPTNFGSLGISAGGHISNVDTLTTYTGNTPQTGDSFAFLGTNVGALGANATSLAPSNTALTKATWTDAKAAFVDAAISSRGTSSLTNAQVSQILQRAIGTIYYVAPGINNVYPVTVEPGGVVGTTTYLYQVIAIAANAGKTLGYAGTTGAGVGITALGNASLSVGNPNNVSWPQIIGAVSYDVLRRDGSAWELLGNVTFGSEGFTDDGSASPTSYAVPASNTTSTGNDGASGSIVAPFQTLMHAASVAVFGDKIILPAGWYAVGDVQIVSPIGVDFIGAGIEETIVTSTYSAAGNSNWTPASYGTVSDLTLDCSLADGKFRLGFGVGSQDDGFVNSVATRVKIVGCSDTFFVANFSVCSGIFTDTVHSSNFDCVQVTNPAAPHRIRFVNSTFIAQGPQPQGTGITRGINLQCEGSVVEFINCIAQSKDGGSITDVGINVSAGTAMIFGGSVATSNENYTLSFTGSPTGGTFTITVTNASGSQTTDPIPFYGAGGQFEADAIFNAVQALSNVSGEVTVGPSGTNKYGIVFGARVAVTAVSASGTSLTGGTSPTAVIANPTAPLDLVQGSPGRIDVFQFTYNPGMTIGTITAVAAPSIYDASNNAIATQAGSLSIFNQTTAAQQQANVEAGMTAQGYTTALATKINSSLPVTIIIPTNISGTIPSGSTAPLAGKNIDAAIDYPFSQAFTINNLDATTWTEIVFMVKKSPTDADSAAAIKIKLSNPSAGGDGLLLLNGAAPTGGTTAADGSITVSQANSSGISFIVALTAKGMGLASAGSYAWEPTLFLSGVKSVFLGGGQFQVEQSLYQSPSPS